MKLKNIVLTVFTLLCAAGISLAQTANQYTQPRILVLLDESSSMLGVWNGGKEKNKVATNIILRLMDSIYAVNSDVEFSLRVFGSQHTVQEHNCTDTRNEVPFSKYNRTQMEFRLEDIHPLGVTAIAYSLARAAEEDLVNESKYVYSIVLITDGGESCNGDICGVMATLLKNKIFFKPYILSLEDVPNLKSEYECMGNYLPVTQNKQIGDALSTIVDAYRPMLNITKVDYKKIYELKAPTALGITLPKAKIIDSNAKTVTLAKPIIKAVDTPVVVNPKPVKTSKIVVDALPEPPKKVQLAKIYSTGFYKMYIKEMYYKPMILNIVIPALKYTEPDLPAPTPVTLKKIQPAQAFKLSYTKVTAYSPKLQLLATPNIVLTQPPATLPPPVQLTKVTYTQLKKFPITKATAFKPYVLQLTKPEIKITEMLVYPDTQQPVVTAPPTRKVAVPEVKESPVPSTTEEPVKPVVKKPTLSLPVLRRSKFKMHLLYGGSFFDSDLKLLKLPTPAPLKPIQITTTTPVTPAPTKPVAAPKPTIGEYTISQEEDKQTTVEVYITNGKGKYYATTPQLRLLDAATNKEVKKFYRTVDANGSPDAIENILPGKYILGVVGRSELIYPVEIIAKKKNKINLIIKAYSLYFFYDGAPDRPVKEFSAEVIQRNVDNGKTTYQRCTERLEYEPGNYHITINTLPEEVRNIDLDISTAGGIAINQPGFVKFTPEGAANNVTLWLRRGERYLQFYKLNLNSPESQRLQLQPGLYQAHYNDGKTKFLSSEKVVEFSVKSLNDTEVFLK